MIYGRRFRWSTGGMFVVPSWTAVDYPASEPANLFAITDRPVLEAFSQYQEETLDVEQEVTGEFSLPSS